MNENKKLFRIFMVDGVEYEGQREKTIVCRHTTEEDIKEEVNFLNKHYPNFSDKRDCWSYYKFEELHVLEKGNMGKTHLSVSEVSEINKQSLRNGLMFFEQWFGKTYEKLKSSGEEKNINLMKEKVVSLYSEFLINGLNENDLFQLIKKMKEDGDINIDVSFLN